MTTVFVKKRQFLCVINKCVSLAVITIIIDMMNEVTLPINAFIA